MKGAGSDGRGLADSLATDISLAVGVQEVTEECPQSTEGRGTTG